MKFQKGTSGNLSGRPKGVPNKTTQTVKEAVVEAFSRVGGAKYLETIAKTEPKAFLTLLGRIIPTELTGSLDGLVVRLVSYKDEKKEQTDAGDNNTK